VLPSFRREPSGCQIGLQRRARWRAIDVCLDPCPDVAVSFDIALLLTTYCDSVDIQKLIKFIVKTDMRAIPTQ